MVKHGADAPDAAGASAPRSDLSPAPAGAGEREPLFIGPIEAGLRHPAIALTPLVLAVLAAVALGLARSPIYSAEARVNVGRADVPAFTLQGVVIGNQTLAAGYSRAVTAEPVVKQAGRAVDIDTDEARSRLAGSPIPGSTLIRVEADGSSERDAVRLANAGADALIAYIELLNRQADTSDLLERFRDAQANELRTRARVRREETLRARRRARGDLTSGSFKDLREARLDLETAQLETERLRNRYQSFAGGTDLTGLLQVIAPAARAESDFASVLQRLIFIAIAAGLVLGIGLALVRANRRLLGRPKA